MTSGTVLIVDDNPDELLIISRTLGKHFPEIKLIAATTGQEALQLLCEPRGSRYVLALVLLDIKMPGMNGIETLHQIRKSPACRYLPVVMLTSSNLKADMESSYEGGANSFVQKSPDYQKYTNELLAIVTYWLTINKVP